MKHSKHLIALVIGPLVSVMASVSDAAIITYSDRTTFLTETGATNVTDPLPNLGNVSDSFTQGPITYSDPFPGPGQFFVGVAGTSIPEWNTLNPGNDVANDVENLDITSSGLVFSMGFDFVEPSIGGSTTDTCFVATCTNSDFTVTLFNGAVPVDSFAFNAPDDVLAFVGVWSTAAFNKLEIREILGGIDDEYFGDVYIGETALVVPEPATYALFGVGLGLVGMAALRRRRETKA